MKSLYIIAGCNGAGKTTSSFTILPEILNCKEFVNADEIARGLSPFQPEKVSIQAGKLMLKRIDNLLEQGVDFAVETTLATKNYVKFIKRASLYEYSTTLLFLWLNAQDLAVERVRIRISEGGHSIPEDVIRRRYETELRYFFNLYKPIVDDWIFINNSGTPYSFIAEGKRREDKIFNEKIWNYLKGKYHE